MLPPLVSTTSKTRAWASWRTKLRPFAKMWLLLSYGYLKNIYYFFQFPGGDRPFREGMVPPGDASDLGAPPGVTKNHSSTAAAANIMPNGNSKSEKNHFPGKQKKISTFLGSPILTKTRYALSLPAPGVTKKFTVLARTNGSRDNSHSQKHRKKFSAFLGGPILLKLCLPHL